MALNTSSSVKSEVNLTMSGESSYNSNVIANFHGNFCDPKFFNFHIAVQDYNMSNEAIAALKNDMNSFVDKFIAEIKKI